MLLLAFSGKLMSLIHNFRASQLLLPKEVFVKWLILAPDDYDLYFALPCYYHAVVELLLLHE